MTLQTISEAFNTVNNIVTGSAYKDIDSEIYDSLPHIRKAIASNSISLNNDTNNLQNSYGYDEDGGLIDNYKTFQKFRQGRGVGDSYLETGIVYAFMSKPNLNLTINPTKGSSSTTVGKPDYNSTENGFVYYIANNYPEIIESLTYSSDKTNSTPMFIPLLYNNFKSTSLEDHNFLENSYGETYRGFSQRLPTTAGSSMAGGTISMSYQENDPPVITYLHKIWFDYIEKVKFGYMAPTQDTIDKKELDYTSSLYYFLCGPDGETIKFWAKYVGLFPQNVPYSAFDGSVGERNVLPPINCTYMYSYKEFLQPEILQDFNDVFDGGKTHSLESSKKDLEIFSDNIDDFSKSESANPNGIPKESDKVEGYSFLEQTAYNSVGVVKDGKDFKLVFYNS